MDLHRIVAGTVDVSAKNVNSGWQTQPAASRGSSGMPPLPLPVEDDPLQSQGLVALKRSPLTATTESQPLKKHLRANRAQEKKLPSHQCSSPPKGKRERFDQQPVKPPALPKPAPALKGQQDLDVEVGSRSRGPGYSSTSRTNAQSVAEPSSSLSKMQRQKVPSQDHRLKHLAKEDPQDDAHQNRWPVKFQSWRGCKLLTDSRR